MRMKNAVCIAREPRTRDRVRSLELRDLPASIQRLIAIAGEIRFGRFENLKIKESLPVLDPPPRLVRDVKLKSSESPAPFSQGEVKDHVVAMIREFRLIGDGTVERLEIKNGLPFRIIVERPYV